MAGSEPKLRELFSKAAECRTAEEQAAYLDEACQGNAELRAKLDELLQAHREAGSFLQEPSASQVATVDDPITERPGTVIGPYKLLQQIGEGGMGTVFMAEQTHPVQRKVALKLIKAGMDSRQVIARFEAERQALAVMDHVNIARVFDGGTTGGEPGGVSPGRPYFVMELVHGVPITKYCDDNHLTPRERLELFVPVCQAIQHAHQKGIIHRDIKPSNVMVTLYDGKPVPKVIDFGVAKATEQKLTERTLFTQYGTMVGTLEYMSPEQAEMSALGVDTRSDIYSLGVLLYELLTGSTPLTHKRMKEAAYAEILRMIKEEEPPKPSTRLSDSGEALASISANRHTEPAKLTKLVRGELDWIVMKTLEKDRNLRYETATGFAMDLQRYLNDEQVLACPPSAGYRLRKFARRNKRVLAVVGLVLFLIVLLGGGAGWVLSDRSARLATTERECETALAEATRLAGQRRWPETLAWVQQAEGVLAHGSGSEALRQRVRDLRKDLEMVATLEEIRLRAEVVTDNRFDAKRDPAYTEAFREYGIDVKALDPEEAAQRIRARSIPVELVVALDDWAGERGVHGKENESGHLRAVARLADPDPWRNRLRDARARSDGRALLALAASDEVNHLPARTLGLLERTLRSAETIEQRLTVLRQAQQRYPDDFWINTALGVCLTDDIKPARPQEAVRFFTAAVALRPRSPGAHYNLGVAFRKSGSPDEAIAAQREAIRLKPDYVEAYISIGFVLRKKGLLDEAIAEYRVATRLKPDYADAHYRLGIALDAKGLLDEAIAEYRVAIRLMPDDANSHHGLALTLQKKGLLDEAIAASREAIRLKPDYAAAHYNLGVVLSENGVLDEAIAAFREALRLKPDDALAPRALDWCLPRKAALSAALGQGAVREVRRISWPGAHVLSVTFTPDGERLLVASDSAPYLRLYELAGGQVLRPFEGHTSWVSQVTLTPDGKRALSASQDKTVRHWDVETGKCLHILKGHTGAVFCVAFSPDGGRAVSGGADKTIRLWHLDSGRELRQSLEDGGLVYSVAFSPDGKEVVSAGANGAVRLWDGQTLEPKRALAGHKGGAGCAVFTPDGRRLLSGGNDKVLRLWDAQSGEELLRFDKEHANEVQWVTLSSDGRRALSTCRIDQTLCLWDLETGKALHRLAADRLVNRATLAPDGRSIACGSFRGFIYLFRISGPATPE